VTPRPDTTTTKSTTDDRLRYTFRGPHSFFRDLLLKAESDQRRRDNFDRPVLRGRDPGPTEPPPRMVQQTISSMDDVDARLKYANLQAREAAAKFDLSSGGASALIPTAQLPPDLARRFEIAARSRAAVASALGTSPIPEDTGMTVQIVGLTSGASVAVQATENSGISETDPAFGVASNQLCYAAGMIDVSRQLLDRAGNGTAGKLDAVIAAELGNAAGTLLDQQILNGSNASGQTRGLLNTTGIQTTAYTSASPTIAGLVSKVGENYSTVAGAYGVGPDVLIAHPRRLAWLASQTIANGENQPNRILSLYDRVIEAPAMPTNLSSTQDALLSIRSEAVHLFAENEISVHTDPGSSTLTVRFRVLVKVAVSVPLGAAVGQVLGTGTTTPTFA
jgi:HK97 family phage major capsid protein